MDGAGTKPEDAAARLLKEAEVLYGRHQAGRRDPFNVFTVLRKSSDEVNLHSRFLAALLDHRKPGEERRANLEGFVKEDFMKKVPFAFTSDGAKVERERHNIDILITNDSRQALAIENKIYADDQDGRIERYYWELKGKGYKDVHVLYLTIDDHDPSEKSTGDLEKEKYSTIAYGEILDWLERCQKRAYDEPELRESVAQYLHLVKKMTGNDRGREYMDELKNLLLRGNNLTISRDLEKAAIDARVHAMHWVWQEIERGLKENPDSFGEPQGPSGISESRIRGAIESTRVTAGAGWFGLYYSSGIENALLGVEANKWVGFIVGVRCSRQEHEIQYEEVREKLEGMGGESGSWWPYCHVVRPDGTGLDPDDLALFQDWEASDKSIWEELAGNIVLKLNEIRERLVSTS